MVVVGAEADPPPPELLGVAGACVVGVMVGGGTDSSEVFGGGVEGVVSCVPKTEVSICCAAG